MTKDFADCLLTWFDQNGRTNLPWQQKISPYSVWVSEIMLQQTQVTTVIPYYQRFMRAFPTLEALAQASEDAVLHHWTGLGYYARARNLHNAAQQIMYGHNGMLPMDVRQLMLLPGIGKSTAGAIVAICTNRKAVILDGNVKRVLARCFAIEGWPGHSTVAARLWGQAESLTPELRVADYTQAIMDLGAMVCTRTNPACDNCPFEDICLARQSDQTEAYPGKKPAKSLPVKTVAMLVIENTDGHFLLEKRPAKGLWGGLWGFPEIETPEKAEAYLWAGNLLPDGIEPGASIEKLHRFRHTFTHFHLDITPVHIQLGDKHEVSQNIPGRCWYSPANPDEIGLTRPVTKILDSQGLQLHLQD